MKVNEIGANRIELDFRNGNRIFFSYGTPVAAYIVGEDYFEVDSSHSVTTSKHIRQWLQGHFAAYRPQAFFDSLGEKIEMTGRPSLHIEARRWHDGTNTYHSVRIWSGEREMHYIPFSYGYDEQWLDTALAWLISEGLADGGEFGTRYLREVLHGTYSVSDVKRKKDL